MTTTQDRLPVLYPQDVGYRGSPVEMGLIIDGMWVKAKRTGVTPPGYPERACYRLCNVHDELEDQFWVYANGELVRWDSWIGDLRADPGE